MFKTYSSEQLGRIIGIISLITSIPVENLNTTVSTVFQLIAVLMFAIGYATRLIKGDVTLLGKRK